MSRISFKVEVAPVAKGRPKFTKRGFAYTPNKTRTFESVVEMSARHAMKGKKLLSGALILTLAFYLPIPKSWSKAKQEQAVNGEVKPTVRPDLDNYVKAIMDSMNRAVYADDCQITDFGPTKKRYSRQPHIEITVEELQ